MKLSPEAAGRLSFLPPDSVGGVPVPGAAPVGDRLLKQKQVQEICGGVDRGTIYHWRKAGLFPEPILINRRPLWRLSDVQRFIAKGGCVKAHDDGDAAQAA